MSQEILISESYSKVTREEAEYSEGKIWISLNVQWVLFTHEIVSRESWIDGRGQLSIAKD